MTFSRCLESPVSETQTHNDHSDALLIFVCQRLPKMIELLGMIRALSSHLAAVGHSIEEHDKKLKYLCQCVRADKQQLIISAEKLHQNVGDELPSLLVLRTYEFKVDAFIDRVVQQVAGQQRITLTGDELFRVATEIMDVYWRVVDDGLDVLHRYQDKQLENWCIDLQ